VKCCDVACVVCCGSQCGSYKFNPTQVLLRFMVDYMVLEQVFLRVLGFFCQYNSANGPYSFVNLHYTIFETDRSVQYHT